MTYAAMNLVELIREKESLEKQYNNFKSKGLSLDMSRGKPSPRQVALSNGLLKALGGDFSDSTGADARNYGNLTGIPEMRGIFADMLGMEPGSVIVCGNSSLNIMFDSLAMGMLFGMPGSPEPWAKCGGIKFLCPSPGYDRHFEICRTLGIEMIPVPMLPAGPDMVAVERLAAGDPLVKGIWCVPAYSNPGGVTYSPETVERLAAMQTAAPDFTIMWDNAYCVHHLYPGHDPLANIYDRCAEHGCPDRPLLFCSFSKITFAGGSVSCVAGSPGSIAAIKKVMSAQTIGHNKVNQLMHARFFGDINGVKAHMEKHAAILRPKFEAVLEILDDSLGSCGFASWSRPKGGYFISLDVMPGTAKRVVALCAGAGVKLTPAGAAFPYGNDPADSHIRVAPSYPEPAELKKAARLLCTAARLAAVEKLLEGLKQG